MRAHEAGGAQEATVGKMLGGPPVLLHITSPSAVAVGSVAGGRGPRTVRPGACRWSRATGSRACDIKIAYMSNELYQAVYAGGESHEARSAGADGGGRLGQKEARMADQGPQKVGSYERPARTKGWIIGGVVLLALIILAIIFFSSRRAGAATLDAGGGYAVSELRRGAGPGWLVRDGAPASAAHA
jgi:hypothetical protein